MRQLFLRQVAIAVKLDINVPKTAGHSSELRQHGVVQLLHNFLRRRART